MNIPGIFLAAGEGKRFGEGKLLSLIEGEPLVVKSLRGAVGSSLEKIVVVLGHRAKPVRNAVEKFFGDSMKIQIVENPRYREGMISSFNTGLGVLNGEEAGVMMLLGDMPFVSGEVMDRMIRLWDGKAFLIPEVGGRWAHPRIVPKRLFQDFMDSGSLDSGKWILEKNRDLVTTVSFRNGEQFRDIDRKDDFPDF